MTKTSTLNVYGPVFVNILLVLLTFNYSIDGKYWPPLWSVIGQCSFLNSPKTNCYTSWSLWSYVSTHNENHGAHRTCTAATYLRTALGILANFDFSQGWVWLSSLLYMTSKMLFPVGLSILIGSLRTWHTFCASSENLLLKVSVVIISTKWTSSVQWTFIMD